MATIPGCPTSLGLARRILSAAVTGSFLAAAIFLTTTVWGSSTVASPAGEQETQVSLLSLDHPQPPPAKVSTLPLAAEEKEEADAFSPDLATELNTWTPTAMEWWMFIGPAFAQPWMLVNSPYFYYYVQLRAFYEANAISYGFNLGFEHQFQFREGHYSPWH